MIRSEATRDAQFTREVGMGRPLIRSQENDRTDGKVAVECIRWISARVRGQPLWILCEEVAASDIRIE
jgi:hypothetical protein